MDEDGIEDAFGDGGGQEGAVEEEDDEVGLGEDERDGGDEGWRALRRSARGPLHELLLPGQSLATEGSSDVRPTHRAGPR